LQQTDVRLVNLRTGVVLDPDGGALARMLPIFRRGLGGRLGNGRQYMSWISRPDLVRIIRFCIDHDSISGPVNAVAPNPVTNAEFSRVLGQVLGRPAVMPVPRLALRLSMGEMAKEILASTRALPEKLLADDFAFNHPDLEAALRALLKN
ncbi:MAG: DUF1731 domain-containing protein, partial [Candidatus Zixiibacteriota bacterium]